MNKRKESFIEANFPWIFIGGLFAVALIIAYPMSIGINKFNDKIDKGATDFCSKNGGRINIYEESPIQLVNDYSCIINNEERLISYMADEDKNVIFYWKGGRKQ